MNVAFFDAPSGHVAYLHWPKRWWRKERRLTLYSSDEIHWYDKQGNLFRDDLELYCTRSRLIRTEKAITLAAKIEKEIAR